MLEEVLLYGEIYSYSVAQFIRDINFVAGNELVVRLDSNGGDPQAAFGMIAKFNEFEGDKLVKVDGRAHSSCLFFVAGVENVECLDTSRFGIHRAAYPDWFEKSDYFTDDVKKELSEINKALKKAFISKVDVKAFEKISTYTIDEIFSMDSRFEFVLNANQAKKIGLVKKVNKMTASVKAEILKAKVKMAAFIEEPKNEDKMTKEDLKSKHPELYAEIEAEIKAKAESDAKIEAEIRAKVEAEIKAKKEKEAKEEGGDSKSDSEAELRIKIQAELEAKAAKDKLEAEGAAEGGTEPVKTPLDSLEAKIDAQLEAEGLITAKK